MSNETTERKTKQGRLLLVIYLTSMIIYGIAILVLSPVYTSIPIVLLAVAVVIPIFALFASVGYLIKQSEDQAKKIDRIEYLLRSRHPVAWDNAALRPKPPGSTKVVDLPTNRIP